MSTKQTETAAAGPPFFCGDLDIRIAADGTWFHDGGPIGRKPLVKLFAGVLRREDDGDYWLVTPVERARIRVEDAPFLAVEMQVENAGRDQVLRFRTNLDDEISAGPEHPVDFRSRPNGEPAPYVRVRGALDALVVRSVYYDLANICVVETVDGTPMTGVWSSGEFFPFEAVAADEAALDEA